MGKYIVTEIDYVSLSDKKDYISLSGKNENYLDVDFSYSTPLTSKEEIELNHKNCIVSFFITNPDDNGILRRKYIDIIYFEKLDKQSLESVDLKGATNPFFYVSVGFDSNKANEVIKKVKTYNRIN